MTTVRADPDRSLVTVIIAACEVSRFIGGAVPAASAQVPPLRIIVGQ